MMQRPTTRMARTLIGSTAAALLLAACGTSATPVPERVEEEVVPPEDPTCETVPADLASYDPDLSVQPGGAVERIRERGSIRIGISADTRLMASRNPLNDTIEGFDIDVAKAIGRAIIGPEFNAGEDLEYKVIIARDRIPMLQSGEIDLVVRNMTITCDRWEEVAFSAEYYHAAQKVLVRDDIKYTDVSDLAGLSVCAPNASTSLQRIGELTEELDPATILIPADNHTGCLVKFQQGEVDAITGDDTVLAGLAAQDPYAVVPDQEALSAEPYGVAASLEDRDLIAFVNAALQDYQAGGGWDRSYDRWLEDYLGPAIGDDPSADPWPEPQYGRS